MSGDKHSGDNCSAPIKVGCSDATIDANCGGQKKVVYLTRIESFSAAHRLNSVHLSEEENKRIFDKCNNLNGHGHNYKVEVTVKGAVDARTGILMNLTDLKKIITDVLSLMDHKHIDEDVVEFKEKQWVSSAENIAIFIFEKINEQLPNFVSLHSVKLYETDKNVVKYKGQHL